MADTDMKQELDDLRKKQSDIKKRIKQIAAAQQDAKRLETWRTITELKASINKLINDSGLSSRYTIKKIASMPDEYVYQHPTDKSKKAYDKNTKWVKEYIKNGGSISNLIEQANKTRLSMWKRTTKRKSSKKEKTDKNADGTSSLSTKAQQGIV